MFLQTCQHFFDGKNEILHSCSLFPIMSNDSKKKKQKVKLKK